jgi:hypothetical protein
VSGEPVINEVRLRRADGQYRWHLIHGVPLHDTSATSSNGTERQPISRIASVSSKLYDVVKGSFAI